MDRVIQLKEGNKVYFASDFHLKTGAQQRDTVREKIIINWLNHISNDAQEIILLGDIFDFWFEYRQVIPKGCVRLLGKLAELSDKGVNLSIFSGNHDMWMFGYFEEEMGIPVFHKPQSWQINQLKIHLGHGDGLGPGDASYKLLKRVFRSKTCQWLFSKVHPTIGMGIAHRWSSYSRIRSNKKEEPFLGDDEWLLQYCKSIEEKHHHDFYLFGHRHLPLELPINQQSKYINLGEWMNYYTFASIDKDNCQLEKWLQ